MRLPWRPREYEAVVEALHEAESRLAASEAVHHAHARKARTRQAQVRDQLDERRKDGR